jgi:glycosyltransferase involved in cell wall biosynthesis
LQQHGHKLVPQLIWVGRRGWKVDNLVREVARTRWLDGKLLWLGEKDGVSEAVLHALYKRCLFTIFPSLYEGWGLPVSESLAYGKYCIVSNASSLPEAGGNLVDYFDPTDVDACVKLTERAIFDSNYRSAKEQSIKRHFNMATWRESADNMLAICKAR